MELVLFIGLQGAGKSSFFRDRFAQTHVLVSKDLLRNNRRPERRQCQLIEAALADDRSVVVDNTNPTPEVRQPLIALARAAGADVVGYYLASPLADCLERNRGRVGKTRVPDVALYTTAKVLTPPSYAEGFDRLYHVRAASGGWEVTDWDEGSHAGK